MDSSSTTNSQHSSTTAPTSLSANSQTAQDYIAAQLRLEADAREALPYQFDTCTKPLGALRQSVFACLTCTPPNQKEEGKQFVPAGVCYSCSISCHGEHELVELFSKRDFECDCGTTRLAQNGTPCSLRVNAETGRKGGVSGEEARVGNRYNQNFKGRFCGCGEEYDPEKEKGTMFQCLGLGTVEQGGCGEDWWHAECLMGLPRQGHGVEGKKEDGVLETVKEEAENGTNGEHEEHDEAPLPAGFPHEDDFDLLICYKCAEAFPWIKAYAGMPGFLPGVAADGSREQVIPGRDKVLDILTSTTPASADSRKRKAEDDEAETGADDTQPASKKTKPSAIEQEDALVQQEQPPVETTTSATTDQVPAPKHASLGPSPSRPITLFLNPSFRDSLCHCRTCFPLLKPHPQLLEEESSYEPPLSTTSSADAGGESPAAAGHHTSSSRAGSIHSGGSLLERGEAALSAMDRVQALEGVRAYNHVKDKVKQFLQPFAESGRQVSSQDVVGYFARLREEEQRARESLANGNGGGGGVEGDGRREQGGY